jgi:hypothetical protein
MLLVCTEEQVLGECCRSLHSVYRIKVFICNSVRSILIFSDLFHCSEPFLVCVLLRTVRSERKRHMIYDMICYGMIWYGMIWYYVTWCDTIWYDMWCDTIRYDMIYDMILCDVIWYMLWHDMIWFGIWYDIMWCYMIRYDMIWYYVMWYDTIWYMIWYYAVWCDTIGYDMIDMIWYDIFNNCNWVATRWQQYSTHYTQTIHRTTKWNTVPGTEHT